MSSMEEKIIKELRERNPYPDDIFIKPSRKTIKEIHKKVKIEGLMGSEGRRVWNLCCNELVKIIQEVEENGKEKRFNTHTNKEISEI